MNGNRRSLWLWIMALVWIGLACGCAGLAAGGLVGYLIGRSSTSPTPTPSAATPWLGIRVAYEADSARILEVLPNSPAEKAGLRAGDRIVAFEGKPVDQAHPLANYLRRYRPGDTVHLTVLRDGEEHTLSITLGHAP